MRKAIGISFLLVFISVPVFSQVEEITAKTGMAPSALCFNLAQVSLRKLDGVSEVNGDAQGGWFRIRVRSGQGVRIKDVQDRITAAGYKKGSELEISLKGKLEKRGNRMVLVVPHQTELFVVEGGAKSQSASKMAEEQSKVQASGKLSGSGNQYNLHIKNLSPSR